MNIPSPSITTAIYESPFGPLLLGATGGRLCLCRPAAPGDMPAVDTSAAECSVLGETRRQLDEWFAGRLREFDLPLLMEGTEFQRRVWERLRAIPYSATETYGHVAAAIGSPRAARAIGTAAGRNRLMIIVPCHRLVGADGSLTGFAWGTDLKRKLLQHEQQYRLL